MTATPTEITENILPVTDSELRERFDHQDELLHQIEARLRALEPLLALATPEVLAMLDKMLNNPAMRWKVRSGRTSVQ